MIHTWTKPVKKEKDAPKLQGQTPSPFDIHSMYIIHRSNHVTQLINLKLLDKSINSTSKPEATGESNPPLLPNHAKYWSQDPHRMTETTDITATSIANTSHHIPKVRHESYQGTNPQPKSISSSQLYPDTNLAFQIKSEPWPRAIAARFFRYLHCTAIHLDAEIPPPLRKIYLEHTKSQ